MSDEHTFSEVIRAWAEVFMHHSMRDFRRLMEETGLSHSQIAALMQLFHCESCGISDIGQNLGITNAAASQLIDRLVQQGLIRREEDSADRRFKRIRLTAQGRALIETVIENRRRWVAALTSALTPQEQATIIAALTLLTAAARKLEGEQLLIPSESRSSQ